MNWQAWLAIILFLSVVVWILLRMIKKNNEQAHFQGMKDLYKFLKETGRLKEEGDKK